jgi:hypothetical protein
MENRFSYNDKLHKLILGFSFFSIASYALYYLAKNNTDPVSFYFVPLDVAQAISMFYMLSILMLTLALLSIYLMMRSVFFHVEIVVTDGIILIPKLGFRKAATIVIKEITATETIVVSKQHFLRVFVGNKKYDFVKSRFTDDEHFTNFEFIVSRSGIFNK